MKNILLISTKNVAHKPLEKNLSADYVIDCAASIDEAIHRKNASRYAFIFLDADCLQLRSRHVEPRDCLKQLWKSFRHAQIVILAEQDKIRAAIGAVKAGADEYLALPIDPTELKSIIANLMQVTPKEQNIDLFRDDFWKRDVHHLVKTRSADMWEVFKKVRSVAQTKSTVLLLGETGVGKGVVANLIHQHSSRSNGPFVSVHCGAIPDGLVESELFGHEKGAFTGAIKKKLGRFELAQGGTIFLDEISTVSAPLQVKLLKVIQESEIQRVGGETDIALDVRLIAASNVDLKEMVSLGRFRQDLYYRLNVFPIEIPPLRHRKEDIPDICQTFLKKMNRQSTKQITGIDEDVVKALQGYNWPGNIRELENLIERAHILETSSRLTLQSFPIEVLEHASAVVPLDVTKTLHEARQHIIEDFERQYLEEVLATTQGKMSAAAELAGIGVRQLHKLLTKYGIKKEAFKG